VELCFEVFASWEGRRQQSWIKSSRRAENKGRKTGINFGSTVRKSAQRGRRRTDAIRKLASQVRHNCDSRSRNWESS